MNNILAGAAETVAGTNSWS